MSSNKIKEVAFKYAVKNAFEHNGSAQMGAVIGKVKALFSEIEIKEISEIVKSIVQEVNSLNKERLEEHYTFFCEEGWELKQIEKEKTLPELDWIKNNEEIITRVAPNPSGAMHFGHARPAVLSDEYVKKYGGKLFIRFDDTDPKTKKPIKGIENEFLEEFKWLGIKVDGVKNASDNLKRYYQVIEELIKKEKAYVCFCNSEEWKQKIWKGKECECRKKDINWQLTNWKKMLTHEIKEGSAVVRIKSDLNQKDTSLIDWWLAKVVDNVEHPNKVATKEHVWPSYNLASAVDDHDMQINFIIRGQEHISNEKKQRQLYEIFNWEYPHTKYHGKIAQIGDMILSKSIIKELMEKEGLSRDDDPRIATLKSFRRRGFSPKTIRKIIFEIGLNTKEVKIDMENFSAHNKEILGEVNNYPFIEEGVECEVIGIRQGEINSYGEKTILKNPIEKFIIDKNEIKQIKKGDIIRLKDGFNIKINEINEYQIIANFISFEKLSNIQKNINWIMKNIEVEVLMSNGTKKLGISSKNLEMENNIIYLQNIGFVKIEEKTELRIKCIFMHK